MPSADHPSAPAEADALRILIGAPIRPGTSSGNDVTAARWAERLRELGHESSVVPIDPSAVEEPSNAVLAAFGRSDLLIVLHARRCAPVVDWWVEHAPGRPLVVGLAGTDLYVDLPDDESTRASLDRADAIVVLQPAAIDRLLVMKPAWADRARVIFQSVDPPLPERSSERLSSSGNPHRPFVVAVSAHLRDVKDPLLTARAARLLPPDSRIRVEHIGGAHTAAWEQAAVDEMAENPRYLWRGEVDRTAGLRLVASADVLACTSRFEGGANVVSEALAIGTPVIGTRIDGNTGLLGDDYPGLVATGDAHALAELLSELETSEALMTELEERTRARHHLTLPATERDAWEALIAAVVGSGVSAASDEWQLPPGRPQR